MKRYSVIDIVQEANALHQSNPELSDVVFVAIIKDTDQEQPFRVVIENFDTIEQAKEQIDLWIAAREQEDMQREKEMREEEKRSDNASKLDSLKKSIIQ